MRSPSDHPLILDVQALQSVEHRSRGIGRYVAEHASALVAAGAVAGALLNPALSPPIDLPDGLRDRSLVGWNSASAYRRLAAHREVAYHVMSAFEFGTPNQWALPPHVMSSGDPLVLTLYDLIPFAMPHLYLREPQRAARYRTRLDLVRSADLVLAISEATRCDAIQMLGLDEDRVVTIGTGISPYFHQPREGESPANLIRHAVPDITRPFVLDVAGPDPRKNVETLVAAYARLPRTVRERLQLVIACPAPDEFRTLWSASARASGLGEGELVITGHVTDAVLRALYRCAEVSVFPSLYEGFGLPIAEAIACGCPTITSNTGALPEILGWPASAFDPVDAENLAAVLQRSLEDTSFREELRRVGAERIRTHTWTAVAEKTVLALRRLPPPRQRPGTRRLRVALVTPLPPTRSGIADVSARVIPALQELCHLDVFQTGRRADLDGASRRFPAAALGTRLNPSSYDAIVYALGNSPHHHDTLDLAMKYPGVLWLHDVRLSDLYWTYAKQRPGAERVFLIDCVRRMYAESMPENPFTTAESVEEAFGATGFLFSREVVAASRSVIVHSAFAERLLGLDQGPLGRTPPIHRLFLPCPPVTDGGSASSRSAPSDGATVVSFGLVGATKQPEALIDAAPELWERAQAKIVFAGPAGDEERDSLLRHAQQIGAGDLVHFTGELSADAYAAWLSRASCAVQLRAVSHGESSAAVRDCLAAGVPVVTNIVGAAEELGDAVTALRPAMTTAELVEAIVRCLTDARLREANSQAGFRLVREESGEEFARRLVAIVRDMPGAGAYAPPTDTVSLMT